MAARGHAPLEFDSHAKQPSTLMHDAYAALGPHPSHRLLNLHSSPDPLERKLVFQGAEMEKLAFENQRLAATHVSLRRELALIQMDLDKIRSHMRTIQAESDIESRGLLEEISKMEADLRSGESLQKNLQEAHMEAKRQDGSIKELHSEVQKINEELLAARTNLKTLPEMHAELEAMRLEHQRLRAAFEYEKGVNIEMVEHMHEMEKNLLSKAKELEKLRAEVLSAEQRAQTTASNTYGNVYAATTFAPAYVGPGAPSGMYAVGAIQVPPTGGVPTEGMSPYGAHGLTAAAPPPPPPNMMGAGWAGVPRPPQT